MDIRKTERTIFISLWGIAFSIFMLVLFVLSDAYFIFFASTLVLFMSLFFLIPAIVQLIIYIRRKDGENHQ